MTAKRARTGPGRMNGLNHLDAFLDALQADAALVHRPENLRFGTAADNDHDIYRQGGKRHKLDLCDVEGIRFGVYCGHTDKELAWNFGVDRTMINRIRNRKRYGWCEI